MKVLPLLCSLLLTTVHAENALSIKSHHGAQSPVPTAAEVSLKLPEKAKLGEALPGIFTVKNTGSEPFEISTGGDYRGNGYPLRLKIRVTDSEGRVLPDISDSQPNFGGMMGSQSIAPGASADINFPLACYATLTGAGIYTVEACHDLGWIVDDARPHPVAKATMEIIMPTADEAKARVRALCTSTDSNKPFELSKLQHAIYLPPLIQEAENGNAAAAIGIGGIRNTEATEALLHLLDHSSTQVALAAGNALKPRLPLLSDPANPAFMSFKENPNLLKDWDPKFREPLLKSALALLQNKDAAAVELGAAFIQAQGDAAHAKPLLDATQTALNEPWEVRAGKGANVLDEPPPLRGLIRAIDALRYRGWSLGPNAGGGTAVILARFRELADPKMPRPADDSWKESVLSFIDANPPTFRQNAVLAIPTPIVDDRFETALMKALEDKDLGVLRSACEVAGKSGRASFIRPLCQIVETTHETFIQDAASSSALALGAQVELWDAWCEVITDPDFMCNALGQMASGTLDLRSSNSSGNGNFTRAQRFSIRDAWRKFLAENRARLARGERVPIEDPSVTLSLSGADFDPRHPAIIMNLKDGRTWPPLLDRPKP